MNLSISNKIKLGHVRELGAREKEWLKLGAREIRSRARPREKERWREREREGGREPLFDYPLARCNNEFIKMLGRMRAQSADPSPSTSKMVLEGLARNNLHLHAYIYVYTNRRIILLRIILHFFFFLYFFYQAYYIHAWACIYYSCFRLVSIIINVYRFIRIRVEIFERDIL